MRKARPLKPGDRIKVQRRTMIVPGVRSMTDPPAPAKARDDGNAQRPEEELSEELLRTIKKAYQ